MSLRLSTHGRRSYERPYRSLERLGQLPRLGKPLAGPLEGHRALRVGSFRIIYRIEPATDAILVLYIASRGGRHIGIGSPAYSLQGAVDFPPPLSIRTEIVEPSRPVLRRAAQPLPTTLGTLDAIHLVTAALWQEARGQDLVMATHDQALALAARASGMRVVGV